jgi:hypothetical protein
VAADFSHVSEVMQATIVIFSANEDCAIFLFGGASVCVFVGGPVEICRVCLCSVCKECL